MIGGPAGGGGNAMRLAMRMARKIAFRTLRGLGLPAVDLIGAGRDHSKWHQDFILHLASVVRPKVYVELGVFQCGLFNRMVPLVERAIAVDSSPEAGRHMRRSPQASFFAGTTAEFARHLARHPVAIDLLFIDADHSREAVAADFEAFFPFVRPHGLILLHDTHPQDQAATDPRRCGDGYRAVEALSREAARYEMMTLPVHPGLTLCRKRAAQLAWQEPAVQADGKRGAAPVAV